MPRRLMLKTQIPKRALPKPQLRNPLKPLLHLRPRSQRNLLQKSRRHHLHQQFQASLQVSNLASRLELLKPRMPRRLMPKTQIPKRTVPNPQLRNPLKEPIFLRLCSQTSLLRKPRQHHLHQQHRASLQVSNLALKPELLKALRKPTTKSSTSFTIITIDRDPLSAEKPNADFARA